MLLNSANKVTSHLTLCMGHNSKSIMHLESCEILADTQSNFAYDEYNLSVLFSYLINPDIEYGAGGQTKKLHTIIQ